MRIPLNNTSCNKIANRLQQLTMKGTNYLQNYSKRLSVRTLKCFLIAFCFLFSGISTYVIVSSFTGKHVKVISITPIRLPPHSLDTSTANSKVQVTYHEYKRLKALEDYLNHLPPNPLGKQTTDSLHGLRSGLLDTIHYVENLYLQQTLKK